jgi:hypothetical protein
MDENDLGNEEDEELMDEDEIRERNLNMLGDLKMQVQ